MFKDRIDAANQLADAMKELSFDDPIVVALPRGGVPMGHVIAQAMKTPLKIVVPRKIGHPTNEEYAIGALVEEGEPIWNERERALVDKDWLEAEIKKEQKEAQRRRRLYGLGKERERLKGKDIILVDDGIATGLTIKAAIATLKNDQPATITLAIPVVPKDIFEELQKTVDRIVYIKAPVLYLGSVGAYYENFPQTSDEEVITLMKQYL